MSNSCNMKLMKNVFKRSFIPLRSRDGIRKKNFFINPCYHCPILKVKTQSQCVTIFSKCSICKHGILLHFRTYFCCIKSSKMILITNRYSTIFCINILWNFRISFGGWNEAFRAFQKCFALHDHILSKIELFRN